MYLKDQIPILFSEIKNIYFVRMNLFHDVRAMLHSPNHTHDPQRNSYFIATSDNSNKEPTTTILTTTTTTSITTTNHQNNLEYHRPIS